MARIYHFSPFKTRIGSLGLETSSSISCSYIVWIHYQSLLITYYFGSSKYKAFGKYFDSLKYLNHLVVIVITTRHSYHIRQSAPPFSAPSLPSIRGTNDNTQSWMLLFICHWNMLVPGLRVSYKCRRKKTLELSAKISTAAGDGL